MSGRRACFLVESLGLSGGVGVVLDHARGLARDHGYEVDLALTLHEYEVWPGHDTEGLDVIPIAEARGRSYEFAIATWWQTAYQLFTLPAERYLHFVQSLEDRFYHPSREERAIAAVALSMPAAFITEARWIRDTLGALRPDARCYLVRNGIDKEAFPLPEKLDVRLDPPLRVLVEGLPGVGHKGIADAIAAIKATREPVEATFVTSQAGAFADVDVPGRVVGPLTRAEMSELYGHTDVVLKTSRVEGMYGPPLEGFHRGATVVTTPVTGHEEYVRHLRNGIVVDWDDPGGTARWIDTLARDRRRLHVLRAAAVETARGWPTWRQATTFFAAALDAEARAPQPAAGGGAAYAAAALRSDLSAMARAQRRLVTDADWMVNVRDLPAEQLLSLWRRHGHTGSELATAAASMRARKVAARTLDEVRARGSAAIRRRTKRS